MRKSGPGSVPSRGKHVSVTERESEGTTQTRKVKRITVTFVVSVGRAGS
jgi:hypothetical protein